MGFNTQEGQESNTPQGREVRSNRGLFSWGCRPFLEDLSDKLSAKCWLCVPDRALLSPRSPHPAHTLVPGVETGAGVEKNVEEKERIHSYLALLFFFNPLLGFPLGATGVVDPAVRMSD